jgi:tripartite-type tricarboxylate transporter receptor subunit TctC
MTPVRRQFLCFAGVATATIVLAQIAGAQGYPMRPITMVVPYGAGGATDTIGRIVAEGMRASLGQPIVIENVTGASGTIGVGRAARSSGDGYTLSLGGGATHVLNSAIFTVPYDALKDFEPVSLIVREPLVIIGKKTGPANNLRELIAWLKANPGKASLGTTGSGGALHVAGVFFQNETGTRLQPVPYRGGGAQAMQDLVAGQLDMMIDLSAGCLPQVRAGSIKAYAVTAKDRLAAVPDIPTVDEAGLPEFYISNWHGLWVPKGTPKHVIAKLNAAMANALDDPTARRRLSDLGQEIFPGEQRTPQALRDLQKAEIEKWWPIIKAAGIKAD